MRWPVVLWFIVGIILWCIAAVIISMHVEFHDFNACAMTFMYARLFFVPLFVADKNESKYELRQYIETRYMEPLESEYRIGRYEIPVLFVPGSGGSTQQVRSIATVMLNKTRMAGTKYTMKFFSVDFNEELSFLSGDILRRQRDFVIKSINTLSGHYSKYGQKKVIVIGHSFGGVVLRSLPTDPTFDLSILEMIIMKAAPVKDSPVYMDEAMFTFYEEVSTTWDTRQDELAHIGVISFSGGEKDFQVPDKLANTTHMHFLPSWSMRGVDTSIDHLCMAWCNQLVRKASRILFDYVLEQEKSVKRGGRQIIDDFVNTERNLAEQYFPTNPDRTKASKYINPADRFMIAHTTNVTIPRDSDRYLQPVWTVRDVAYRIGFNFQNESCGTEFSAQFRYNSGLIVKGHLEDGRWSLIGTEMVSIFVQPQSTHDRILGLILVSAKSGCKFEMKIGMDPFISFYMSFLGNVHSIAYCTLMFIMVLAITEVLYGRNEEVIANEISLFVTVTWFWVKFFFVFAFNFYVAQYLMLTCVILLIIYSVMIMKVIFWLVEQIPCPRQVAASCMNWVSGMMFPIFSLGLYINPYISCAVVACVAGMFSARPVPTRILVSLIIAGILLSIGFSSVHLARSHRILDSMNPGNSKEVSVLWDEIHHVLPMYAVELYIALGTPIGRFVARMLQVRRLTGVMKELVGHFILGSAWTFAIYTSFITKTSLEYGAVVCTAGLILLRWCEEHIYT